MLAYIVAGMKLILVWLIQSCSCVKGNMMMQWIDCIVDVRGDS